MSEGRRRTFTIRAVFMTALLALATAAPRAGTFTVFGPRTLTGTTGRPNVFEFTFRFFNQSLPYTLHIGNGGVDSAVVTLNGIQVLAPRDFEDASRRS